jgi:hypothetical protein
LLRFGFHAALRLRGRGPVCGSITGSVFARRFSSVLPPPSRLFCASASALPGRWRDLAFTRITSSGWLALFQRSSLGNLKCTERKMACSRSDAPTAAVSTRDRRSSPAQYSAAPGMRVAIAPCNGTSRR